jgi:hypothetical protein
MLNSRQPKPSELNGVKSVVMEVEVPAVFVHNRVPPTFYNSGYGDSPPPTVAMKVPAGIA